MKWMILPEHREEFIKKNITTSRKIMPRVGSAISSGPSSPALKDAGQTISLQPPLIPRKRSRDPEVDEKDARIKISPTSATPPNFKAVLRSPTKYESFTPERGPRSNYSHLPKLSNGHGFEQKHVITPARTTTHDQIGIPFAAPNLPYNPNYRRRASDDDDSIKEDATDSPTSYPAYYSMDHPSAAHNAFQTPMIARNVHLPAPSTAHLPSTYLNALNMQPLSSPAFWKFANLGSTPAKGFDFESPVKDAQPVAKDSDPSDQDQIKENGETLVEKDEGKEGLGVPQSWFAMLGTSDHSACVMMVDFQLETMEGVVVYGFLEMMHVGVHGAGPDDHPHCRRIRRTSRDTLFPLCFQSTTEVQPNYNKAEECNNYSWCSSTALVVEYKGDPTR
jgi:hypothetical protein